MICFLLGFGMGVVSVIGSVGFLIYKLCRQPDNTALASVMTCIGETLRHQPISPEPLAPAKIGEGTEEARPKKSGR
jgi:hypothetical protein